MIGIKDPQSVTPRGEPIRPAPIQGVRVRPLANVLTRSGLLTEVFRQDWFDGVDVRQVNWVELVPDGVTDWHRHAIQTDRLVGVFGQIKLCLYDGREQSETFGTGEVIRFGAPAPCLAVVPPGVWHGLRNVGGAPAGYINVIDQMYDHETPDNDRLGHDSDDIPIRL